MADLPVTPLADYGNLLSSLPTAMSNIQLQGQQEATAAAQRTQIPSQIASTQAGTAYTQAQTQTQLLQNAFTQVKLDYLNKAMDAANNPALNDQSVTGNEPPTAGGPPPAAPATSAAPTDSTQIGLAEIGLDPAHITDAVQQQYAVRDTYTPQEVESLAAQPVNKMVGLPDNTDNIKAVHAANLQNQITAKQKAASSDYDNAVQVTTADPGTAFATMQRIHAGLAANLQKVATANDWTPDQLDQATRVVASETANAMHKYTGRDIDVRTDGSVVDKQTQQPVPGANPLGLSPAQHADAIAKAQDIVPVKQADGSIKNYPKWQVDGAPSAEAWINGGGGGSAAGYVAPTGSPVATTNPATTNHPVTGAAPGTPPAAGGHALPPAIAADPTLSKALGDPDYAQPIPQNVKPNATAQSQTPGAQATMEANAKAQVDARNGLLSDAASDTKAAQTSLTYLQAAKAILDSKGAPIQGPLGNVIAWAGAASHLGTVNAANYQEAAKYLGNAALPGIAEKFGTSRTTGNEVALQMDKLSPSLSMADPATRNLLDKNIAYAQYMIDSAKRVAPFLQYGGAGKGGDPQRFAEWNHDNYPAEKIVNASAPAAKPAPAVTSKAQYDALPSGATYTYNGRTGTKP